MKPAQFLFGPLLVAIVITAIAQEAKQEPEATESKALTETAPSNRPRVLRFQRFMFPLRPILMLSAYRVMLSSCSSM